jgi:eukaryotic-like serine/threonine-protein kinase
VKTCGQCGVNYPDAVEYCPRDGQKLPPVPGDTQRMYDPLIGTTIDGRYIIEALLGEGGMGYVYAARHAIIDKRVAIKVLRKEAAADESAAQRFIIEAKAASKIGHQNIVDITDFGVLPAGHAYFVMEFLDGPTLGKLVHELKHLPPLRSIAICTQVARGLAAAHAKSIIHRDLKPENIFVLEKDGVPDVIKIVDFGIAKDVKAGKRLTAVGMVLGTPEYMSPEQATGQESDHRVDQYALGCILYEMLTGDVPFKGENAPKTLTKHVFDAVVPPSKLRPDLHIPAVVEDVVLKTLQKKPEDRYADMRALIDAFEAATQKLDAGQTAPRPMPPTTESIEELPRNKMPLYVALGVGAAATLLLVVLAVARLSKSAPAAAASSPKQASATPVPRANPTTAAAPAAEVEIQLSTVPPGAEVLLGAEPLGLSPLAVKRPRAAEAVTLAVKRAGFKDVTRTLTLDHDQTLEVVLQPKRDKVASRTTRPQGKTQSGGRPAQAPQHHVSDLRNPFE